MSAPKVPRLSDTEVRAILNANKVPPDEVAVVAIRGYWLRMMGDPTQNDRGIWDDAHVVMWRDGYAAFQGNTDPSSYRKGQGTGEHKGMAVLKPGKWIFGTGLHKGTLAFRQCIPFTVIRDGDPPYEDTGFHAINWHSGGIASTSSAGCQTNPASIFQSEVRPLVYRLLERYGNPKRKNDRGQLVHSFYYILIEETQRRKGKLTV